ncbi:MAG: formylglycine-generating enzyme family protein [Planctomycetes bacterium]|nr:formylglycine-generating enzyme family protein [Planctomycetota bacterium]
MIVKHIIIWCVITQLVAGCASTHQTQDYVQVIKGSAIEFEMVWIPQGNFWIGRTEVTWDEFLLYCDFECNAAIPPGADAVTKPSEPITAYDHGWGFGRRPAVGMSLNAAREFCRWISLNTGKLYQLPTETEWELACGLTGYAPLDQHAWYAENSDFMTQNVGQKNANRYGLYDMLGNLWEYCQNPYNDNEPKRPVLRGGSWKEPAARVTPLSRLGFDDDWILDDPNVPPGVWWVPDGDHLGFRVLRLADEKPFAAER